MYRVIHTRKFKEVGVVGCKGKKWWLWYPLVGQSPPPSHGYAPVKRDGRQTVGHIHPWFSMVVVDGICILYQRVLESNRPFRLSPEGVGGGGGLPFQWLVS